MTISLSPEQVRWILHAGPTITVASRSARMRPSIGQAIGCRIDPDACRLTVFLPAGRNRAVIADLRAGREVAVVMTRSSTTRSLQVKAAFADEVPMTPADHDRMRDYVELVAKEWARDGVPQAFTRTLLDSGPGPILAFDLALTAAFDQTPGPRAGAALQPAG